MLQQLRAYANGDPALDYRSRFLGNLVLALGFSSALHAALLSSLALVPVRPGVAPGLRFTADIRELPVPAAAPAAAVAPPASAAVADAGAGTTLPDRYFTAREVDTPATPRERVPLIYPENPYVWKLRGVVRVRVFINERGEVDDARVVHAEPAGEFEDAALDAVRRMSYQPAIRNARAVKSQKLIEVTFDPYEGSDRPQPAPR